MAGKGRLTVLLFACLTPIYYSLSTAYFCSTAFICFYLIPSVNSVFSVVQSFCPWSCQNPLKDWIPDQKTSGMTRFRLLVIYCWNGGKGTLDGFAFCLSYPYLLSYPLFLFAFLAPNYYLLPLSAFT